ncbi:class I SAM-dependent methyltransferase [Acuticoccus sp.]|uniref:class I SAM-dependent methyltransferase n=1 Tax=Acuticoccus sp. TaxID=1904378 RepID=UPI003B5167A7
MISIVDPVSRRPLVADTAHSLTDGVSRWPVADGIPYLRTGREELRAEALAALDAGDETAALTLLLADQDDFAPLPPPDDATIREVVASPDATFREAMGALNFGPVADYFAHRWSAPTFLSGVALAALYAPSHSPFVEVCCGTGQLLREFAAHGFRTAGVDLVFSKLWLGRRYLKLDRLVCANAETLPIEAATSATVLAHDALYFLPDEDKAFVIAAMERTASGGAVLAGHCHVAGHDHAGSRAYPMTVQGWCSLLPGASLIDDASLTDWFVSMGAASVPPFEGDAVVAAVSLAFGSMLAEPTPVWAPPGLVLRENPLLASDGNGGLLPHWPSEDFAREYADAHYLSVPDGAAEAAMPLPVRHARRTLVPLPDLW